MIRISASAISGKRASHVIAGVAVEPHAVAILACDDAKSVVLDETLEEEKKTDEALTELAKAAVNQQAQQAAE